MKMAKRKKRATRAIIQRYLEKVGSGVFERYQDAITGLVTGKQGVYALYRRDKLYYVGLASDLRGRIRHHLKDKHKGKWDRFSLYVIKKEDHVREVESLLVRIAEPEGNRQKGKLKRSSNLLPELKREVKQKQDEERETFFEQHEERTKRGRRGNKQGTRAEKRMDRPLKGLFPTGKCLYTTYKGKDYKAWVNSSGTIEFNGKRYDSPSSAALAILDSGTVNGWWFWKYKDKSGNLVRLREARK